MLTFWQFVFQSENGSAVSSMVHNEINVDIVVVEVNVAQKKSAATLKPPNAGGVSVNVDDNRDPEMASTFNDVDVAESVSMLNDGIGVMFSVVENGMLVENRNAF